MKKWKALVALLIVGAASLAAQSQASFEVASIKVHSFQAQGRLSQVAGNRLFIMGNVNQLVMYAYDLKAYQISGGPGWVTQPSTETDYYDINATAPGETALTVARARQLLQGLLADRFQLKVHRETKQMPVYALVVGKNGSKLKESAAAAESRAMRTATANTFVYQFEKSSVDMLVRTLAGPADRPVLDETGLRGLYDMRLEFARDPVAAFTESNAASIFTAVQDELGLKLEPRRAAVEVVIIDGAERPSAN